MNFSLRPLLVLLCAAILAAFVPGCATAPVVTGTPPLVLISLDGFRWDYVDKYPAETPVLRQLIAGGSHARGLIPVYPSNTFPNHYSIVTGLYPAHHGIINNDMFDPTTGMFFHYNRPASAHENAWWGGEPIWVTARRQGHPAMSSFWVGSEAEIKGFRPTQWRPYNYSVPFQQRLDELAGWLALPEEQRPRVVTFYLEETNSVGHKFGPDSPELAGAVKLLDGRIGAIRDRLQAEQRAVNLVIVSDHGMTPISPDRVLLLDDYLDLSSIQIDFIGPEAGLRPLEGSAESIVRALSALPHAKAYLERDLPARLKLQGNPRIPPVWIMADEGWEIDTRKHFQSIRSHYNRADHGYDPAYRSMQGILIAQGPAFKSGVTIDPVENVHIYNLLCAAAGLKPAPNDGDNRLVEAFLKNSFGPSQALKPNR